VLDKRRSSTCKPRRQRVSADAGVCVLGNAHGNHLQRAERDRDERSGREFHGNGGDQRQRLGCADGSTNDSFEAG